MTGHEYRRPRLGAAVEGQQRLRYARCSCGWEDQKGAVLAHLVWRGHAGGSARAESRRRKAEREANG